jgi:hypothetical protein
MFSQFSFDCVSWYILPWQSVFVSVCPPVSICTVVILNWKLGRKYIYISFMFSRWPIIHEYPYLQYPVYDAYSQLPVVPTGSLTCESWMPSLEKGGPKQYLVVLRVTSNLRLMAQVKIWWLWTIVNFEHWKNLYMSIWKIIQT